MRALIIFPLVVCACATPPKPHEFETFEQLRAQQMMEAARKRSPDLMTDSDALFKKAEDEWKSKKLDDARRDALMGSIKLKTAFALVEQADAKTRTANANAQYAKVDDELGRVAKDLNAANTQITLMQKLAEARSAGEVERIKMQQKLAEEQSRASARDRLAAAELALKNADTVDAASHAKAEYGAASDLLARAQAEIKKGDFAAASTSADQAKQKAEQAYAAARPLYDANAQNQSSKARDDALGREAAGLPGVQVRLDRRGESQRLVLPLRDLFTRRSTAIAPGEESRLDAIAALIKKYPNYSVQVIGHTDSRGKHGELVALSLARAQSVFTALVMRGVDAKRLTVSGQGPDEPAGESKTTAGRALNNRVEVIFLY
jgi:outer membrane protein OmpA-like peptidoglycan-associated protein